MGPIMGKLGRKLNIVITTPGLELQIKDWGVEKNAANTLTSNVTLANGKESTVNRGLNGSIFPG
jgi:hypothetical protein